jgi:hypothetical protein
MEIARKITVEVPRDLLEKAQQSTGTSITQTVRTGLQLVAASRTGVLRAKVLAKHRKSHHARPGLACVC